MFVFTDINTSLPRLVLHLVRSPPPPPLLCWSVVPYINTTTTPPAPPAIEYPHALNFYRLFQVCPLYQQIKSHHGRGEKPAPSS